MHFTPGEKAVLGQIRVLYAASSRTDQPIKALTMQWTPTHHETYRKAFAALVAKQLIHDTGEQFFRITEAGLRAIGVAIPRPQPQPQPRAAAPQPAPQRAAEEPRPRRGLLSRALGLFQSS
jgi:hypothetical protein